MTRHRLDVFSLLAGLFFTTIATLSLTGGWSFSAGPWMWPSVLIGAGVIVLLALLSSARDKGDNTVDASDLDAEAGMGDDAVAPHHIAEARAEAEAADPFSDTTPMELGNGDDG